MNELAPCKVITTNLYKNEPTAKALIKGNEDNPNLFGMVYFYETPYGGVIVNAEIYGLPQNSSGFYGFHIHENGNCNLPFDMTGEHYNPYNTVHPIHSGDMPPLLSSNGYAWIAFYDGRITINEIIGKSVVIHDMRDDFTSQPSGGAGNKIGCGVITSDM